MEKGRADIKDSVIAGSLIVQWQLIWSIHALWKPDLKLLEPGELGLMVFMSSVIAVFVRPYESDELRLEPERLHTDMGRNTALL